jgi:MFS family permease
MAAMTSEDARSPLDPDGADGSRPDSALPVGGQARGATFESLQIPNYRKFFVGQTVSLAGTWMQSVAMAWLVLRLTGSATWLGATIALQTLPILLIGPYAGVVVDRLDKRRLLVGTQSIAAAQAILLAGLTLSGHITMAWVLVLSLGLGAVNSFDNPARQSFVREMVPEELVRNAVTLNSVVVNVARAVGPAVAGILIAVVGESACFVVNALSFLAVIAAYLLMDRSLLRPSVPTLRAPGQLREGLSYVRHTPDLFVPLLMMALVGTLTYEFQVSLPALSTRTFSEGPQGLGAITAAMGVGAVIGGLVSASRRATGLPPLVASAAAFGLATALVALSPDITLACVALVAVGAASVWFLSVGNATLQLTSRPQMRGRVMALWAVAFLGTTPVGGPLIGWIAQQASPRWALAIGAAAALVAAGFGAAAMRRSAPLSPAPSAP